MPLFEVDAERPVLVQPTPPPGGFGTAAQRVVDGNLDGLLGEQIFPVAQGRSPAEPHLIALDAAGLPVVIDVVGELTEESLVRALNHAGAAGHLTRSELAARYHRGPKAFHRDVASFYDNVALAGTLGQSPAGTRLIMICQGAADGVLDALDFLRQPESHVAVLRLGVVKTADGRRFVDVSPLAVSREPRSVERATQLTDYADFAEGVAVGHALTGKIPVVTRRRVDGVQPAAASSAPGAREAELLAAPPPTVAPPSLSAPPTSASAPPPTVASTPFERSLPSRSALRHSHQPTTIDTRETPTLDTVARTSTSSGRVRGGAEQASPLDRPWASDPLVADAYDVLPLTRPTADAPLALADSYPAGDWAFEGSRSGARPDLSGDGLATEDDPDLIALAKSIGNPASLVWSRPRRGERYQATLLPDGHIVLVDGSRFRHPDLAAIAVSGTPSADGWSVWRFGDDGPTLTDAFRIRFS